MKNMQIFLNELFVMFYKWIELDLKLNVSNLKGMFELLILKDDQRYIRLLDERIENDIFSIQKVIKNIPNEYRKFIFNFIICCIDLYIYDSIEVKNNLQMNMLYYKYILSKYFIDEVLNGSFNKNKYSSFKDEFYQIGVIINQYYNTTELNKKETILSIIKSKASELFKRYKVAYCLPPCTL